jgi:hypothetical protein
VFRRSSLSCYEICVCSLINWRTGSNVTGVQRKRISVPWLSYNEMVPFFSSTSTFRTCFQLMSCLSPDFDASQCDVGPQPVEPDCPLANPPSRMTHPSALPASLVARHPFPLVRETPRSEITKRTDPSAPSLETHSRIGFRLGTSRFVMRRPFLMRLGATTEKHMRSGRKGRDTLTHRSSSLGVVCAHH